MAAGDGLWRGAAARGRRRVAIVAGVVAVVLFAFDLLVHSKRAENLRRLLGDLYDQAAAPYEPALDLKKLVPVVLLAGCCSGAARRRRPRCRWRGRSRRSRWGWRR
jgi:hypothetical protein